jgi:ABC-type Na+ efflux pump permease subunit
MTFVGKILVVVIMAFALISLGITTVVFTTHTNWKDATEKERAKVSEFQRKLTDVKHQAAKAENDLKAAQTEHANATKALEQRIEALETDIKDASDQTTESRKALGVAEQNAKIALEEADARKKETDQLRSQKVVVEKQANDYKLRQTELNDKIRELERMLETATKNNKELRENNARLSTALRSHGLSDDVTQYAALTSPQSVEGEVTKVDKLNRTVEISIGSDDGLASGHELYLYRTKPRPEYLGKIKVLSVDPDQAVGKVIGTTVQGKKIQEGDIVSSTIRPRS